MKENLIYYEEKISERKMYAFFLPLFGSLTVKVIITMCPFYSPLECLAESRQGTSLNLKCKLMPGK